MTNLDGIVELNELELSEVAGALPAVQKVREAAARLSFAYDDDARALSTAD